MFVVNHFYMKLDHQFRQKIKIMKIKKEKVRIWTLPIQKQKSMSRLLTVVYLIFILRRKQLNGGLINVPKHNVLNN